MFPPSAIGVRAISNFFLKPDMKSLSLPGLLEADNLKVFFIEFLPGVTFLPKVVPFLPDEETCDLQSVMLIPDFSSLAGDSLS